MKQLFLTLLLIMPGVVGSAARAADTTEKLLDATRVEDVLRLQVGKPGGDKAAEVSYEIDAHRSGILHDGDTFAAAGSVDLTYADFNPLLVSATATQTSSPDPVQAAIDSFLAELTATAKLVVAVPAAQTGGAEARLAAPDQEVCVQMTLRVRDATRKHQMALNRGLVKEKKLTEAEVVPAAERASLEAFSLAGGSCEECHRLTVRFQNVRAAIAGFESQEFDPADLQRWVAGAAGRAGIVTTRGSVQTAIDLWKKDRDSAAQAKENAVLLLGDLLKALPAARVAEGRLESLIGSLEALRRAGFPGCELPPELLAEAQSLPERAQQVVDRDNHLLEGLNGVLAVLKANEQRRWRNDARDLVVDTVETDPASIKTAKVSVKLIHFAFDKDKYTISSAVDVAVERTLDVRRYRRLVAEFGLAGVYNDLRYPKYSVKEEAGVRTVAREFDTSNVNIAATLNLLCPHCIGNGLYPGFQLGVSKAKDYPGLLAGGVLRFAGKTRLSVATGVMVTWYKDLNKLTVGGPVESTDKLQNDLKLRRSPSTWYLAVQYTF